MTENEQLAEEAKQRFTAHLMNGGTLAGHLCTRMPKLGDDLEDVRLASAIVSRNGALFNVEKTGAASVVVYSFEERWIATTLGEPANVLANSQAKIGELMLAPRDVMKH